MHDIMKHVSLANSETGKKILASKTSIQSGKRTYISSLMGLAKRHSKDLGITNTPSTRSPKFMHMSRIICFEFATTENLANDLENGLLFHINNTFRGQSCLTVIKILRSGYLQHSDLTMLVAETEARQVKVS